MFTHWLPQSVRPVWQVHVPLTQPEVRAVPGQALPHAPQLLRSFCRSRQVPLQLAVPTGHWQAPATQNWPVGQVRPQAPQLFRSLCRSRHVPLHWAKPPVQ